jgi:hypothetical protein
MKTQEAIIALAKASNVTHRTIHDLYDALAALIGSGCLTVECADALLDDAEIIDGAIVPEPGKWQVSDGHADLEIECASAEEACREFFDGGDWGTDPCLVPVTAWRRGIDADGDVVQVGKETHEFTVTQPEPDCEDGETHDWQSPYRIVGGCKENPGVWGSNHGGVRITEVCMKCGCRKVTDTGDTDYGTGRQMETVTYDEGYYADEIKEG